MEKFLFRQDTKSATYGIIAFAVIQMLVSMVLLFMIKDYIRAAIILAGFALGYYAISPFFISLKKQGEFKMMNPFVFVASFLVMSLVIIYTIAFILNS